MGEGKRELLKKVDEGKRDFMRKLAIGSAYAVPVMASFPLDSVRNKAWAQAVYGPPAVVSLRALPDSDFNPSAVVAPVSQLPVNGNNVIYPVYWVITFDRPMNKNYKGAIYYNIGGGPCGDGLPQRAQTVGPSCEMSYVDKCGGGDAWHWTGDGTRLYMGFDTCQGTSTSIGLVLNPGGNCTETPFQDPAGGILPRTEGCADYCETRDLCA